MLPKTAKLEQFPKSTGTGMTVEGADGIFWKLSMPSMIFKKNR
jgi:hypothetical protein